MTDEAFLLKTLLRAFPGIPMEEARALIRSGTVKTYPEGSVLCHENARESTFYILLEGRVKVTKRVNAAGIDERTLKTLSPGDFFGEMALIHNAPRAATVATIDDAVVLEIYKEDFKELLNASASIARALMQEAVSRLRTNDNLAIEELRLRAGELALAYQKLAEQEYARRTFLTTIAHELRTPLTAASGFLKMMELRVMTATEPLDPDALTAGLHTAARHLEEITTLVNDILFAQEMDLILPHFEPVDLERIVQAALGRLETQRQENDIELTVYIPGALPPVLGDGLSLERAVGAVLDNAIKFSRPGGRVELQAGQAGGCIWLEVRDQGVGIPEETLPYIYERFFHLDQVSGRLFRGAGLGLSIARQVIDQHQGSIQVRSALGEGTQVRIELGIGAQGL